jgi:hypothetical protein
MKIKSLSLKGKCCILFSIFFISLSLVTVPHVYGNDSVSNETTQEIKTEKKIDAIYDEFLSKCDDLSVNIKEVEEAYQKHIKDLKEYNKIRIFDEKRCFKTIKKDYYKYISKKEQKEIERVTKNYIQAVKTENKVFMSVSSAMYKLAKADRNKSPNAKYEIEKAEENFDIARNKISFMLTKLSVAIDEYNKVYDDVITKNIKEILRKKFNNKNNVNKQIRCKGSKGSI